MNLAELCLAVRHTEFFTAVRQSAIVYPAVLATHLTCIGIFGAMILATNLRLMGTAFTGTTAGIIIASTRRWKQVGFIVMATCGILLAGSKLDKYYPNPYFQLKLGVLAAIWVHSILFRDVYRHPEGASASRAKLAGATSLLLWLGMVMCGRWIAYWDPPDAIAQLFGQLPL